MSTFVYTITVDSPSPQESIQNVLDQLAARMSSQFELSPSPTTTGSISNVAVDQTTE